MIQNYYKIAIPKGNFMFRNRYYEIEIMWPLDPTFMKTAKTEIDVYAGTLSMEFGDITVHFNILDAMKHPPEDSNQ